MDPTCPVSAARRWSERNVTVDVKLQVGVEVIVEVRGLVAMADSFAPGRSALRSAESTIVQVCSIVRKLSVTLIRGATTACKKP
jgi:hypothetical protein